MGEAKRKRLKDGTPIATGWKYVGESGPIGADDAMIENLMAAQPKWAGNFPPGNPALPYAPLSQDDIPPELNVFATMEAAWNDLVDRWFHEGMPDKLKQDGKFIFYHGVQAAANLMMYCEGQDMFGAAADQVQGDCIAYEKEAEAVLAERKAEEWRTGEI